MATIITNQATLNYRYGGETAVTTVSNIASTVLDNLVEISKTALNPTYRMDDNITYIINVNNRGAAVDTITVRDNLGTYTEEAAQYTPLTYGGVANLYINGVLSNNLTVTTDANGVAFVITGIPAGSNAQIIYQGRVNRFADMECGGFITNTITAECDCLCNIEAEDSYTVAAECYADVGIFKSVCPNPIVCGEELTYVFDIYNYGNIDAEDVVLTDTFDPALADITVLVDGVEVPATNYTYVGGLLTLPAEGSGYTLTVPAATFARDEQTGEFLVNPGRLQITVKGTV